MKKSCLVTKVKTGLGKLLYFFFLIVDIKDSYFQKDEQKRISRLANRTTANILLFTIREILIKKHEHSKKIGKFFFNVFFWLALKILTI